MANPAPVSGKQWNNTVSNGISVAVTISTPTSGAGKMLAFGAAYGGGDSAFSIVTAGGTTVVATERIMTIANNAVGVTIYDITYDAAPTSVTLQQDGALGGFYATCAVTEVSDFDSFDVVSATADSATATTSTATALPDTTDAQGMAFGVWTQNPAGDQTVAPGSGWTMLFDLDPANDNATLHVIYKQTTAGANDPNWTHDSVLYYCAGIGIKGVAAGVGTNTIIIVPTGPALS